MSAVRHATRFLVVASTVTLFGCAGSADGSGGTSTLPDKGEGGDSGRDTTSSSAGGKAPKSGAASGGSRASQSSEGTDHQSSGGTKAQSTSRASSTAPKASGGNTGWATSGVSTSAAGGKSGSASGGTKPGAGGSTAKTSGGASAGGLGGSAANTSGGKSDAGGSVDGYPLGNDPVKSSGCGKALSTFKSGLNSYEMNSASIKREYYVNIPSNYDPAKPYRLVFGMHCMGSSATQCAKNDHFYRLQPLDKESSTIFVAPQGYTDSSPWRGGDNKDHIFFEDMVKLVESELCIDTSRVFSVGFSFGAMFTNSLAQTHQDILRGVVVYATADYNIYFPTNTGKPLAYFGVHGTGDGTCPFKSGSASKERFVKNNGCKVPSSVPEATSSTHVCYDYECPSNYPVKWCTHNGGHTDLPTDPGQSSSWDIDLTWKFLTQF